MKNDNSILKFFQANSAGLYRMPSSVMHAFLLRTSRFWLVCQMLLFIVVGGFINGWHVPLAMATLSLQRASGCVTSVYVLEYTLFGDKQKIPFSGSPGE